MVGWFFFFKKHKLHHHLNTMCQVAVACKYLMNSSRTPVINNNNFFFFKYSPGTTGPTFVNVLEQDNCFCIAQGGQIIRSDSLTLKEAEI